LKALKKYIYFIGFGAIAAIVAILFLADGNISGSIVDVPTAQPIHISAELNNIPELQFNRYFETIQLTLADPTNVVRLGNGLLDVENGESEITLQGFSGNIYLGTNTVTINGEADKVLVNNVGIKKDTHSIRISTENAKFEEIALTDLNIASISSQASGELTIADGKGSFDLSEDPITIRNFNGDLNIEEEIELTGTVSEINVGGILIHK
jgi:hypothetical protein